MSPPKTFYSSCQQNAFGRRDEWNPSKKGYESREHHQRTLKTFCSSFLSEGVKKERSLPLPPLIFRCSESYRDIFLVQRFVEARILLDQNFTQRNGRFSILEEIWTCLSSASARCTKKSSIRQKYLSIPSTSINKPTRRFWTRFSTNPNDSWNLLSLQQVLAFLASRLAALLWKAALLIQYQRQAQTLLSNCRTYQSRH